MFSSDQTQYTETYPFLFFNLFDMVGYFSYVFSFEKPKCMLKYLFFKSGFASFWSFPNKYNAKVNKVKFNKLIVH